MAKCYCGKYKSSGEPWITHYISLIQSPINYNGLVSKVKSWCELILDVFIYGDTFS